MVFYAILIILCDINIFKTDPPFVFGYYLPSESKKMDTFTDVVDEMLDVSVDESLSGFGPYKVVSTYRPMNGLKVQTILPDIGKLGLGKLAEDTHKIKVIEEYKKENPLGVYFFRFLGEFGEAIAVLDKTGKPIDYIDIYVYGEKEGF